MYLWPEFCSIKLHFRLHLNCLLYTEFLTPSGTVCLDCGSQQMFTCQATSGSARWTLRGLPGRNAEKNTGVNLASYYSNLTTADTNSYTYPTSINITGFSMADNGGVVECVDQNSDRVEAIATIVVGESHIVLDQHNNIMYIV